MASQLPSQMEVAGDGNQSVVEEDDSLDQEELDNPDDIIDPYEPQPDAPLSDAKHDLVIVLVAAMLGLIMMVSLLWLNFLSYTGVLGSGCGTNLSNRISQCDQANTNNQPRYQYTPSPMFMNGVFTPTNFPTTK